MTYNKITTHKEDSISNLIFDFKKEILDIKEIVSIDGDRFQTLENTLYDIYLSQFIDFATGISLEIIGKEVGEPRPISGDAATDDDIYRYLIKARIAANRSNGTLPEIYNILGLLGATDIISNDVPNAALQLYIKGDLLLPLEDILKTLIGATAPISLEITEYSDMPFGFIEDPKSYGFDEGELGDSIST